MKIQVIALALLHLAGLCLAADKTMNAEGVYLRVKGQSGKIEMSDNAEMTDSVTIAFDEIKEYAADKTTVVGTSGQSKHSYNSFASLDFTFSDIETDITFLNLTCNRFNFSSTVPSGSDSANINVQMLIFKEDGQIDLDGEETKIKKGNMKFNVEIQNWKFCGSDTVTCTKGSKNEVGAYLDLVIEMKGKGTNKPSKIASADSKGDVYDFGDNTKIIMSKKVLIDDVWQDMTENYPMMEEKGKKFRFHYFFQKFTTSVWYDPTVVPGSGAASLQSFGLLTLLLIAIKAL